MSEAREDKPTEPAAPEAETEDELRQAIEEEEAVQGELTEDPDDSELEPQEDADPEPPRRTREERDQLRREKHDLEEEARQSRALLERQRLSQPRIDPARQAQLEQEERERVAMMPLHEQHEYWDRRYAQRGAQLKAELDDKFAWRDLDQRMRELQLPYSYRFEVENLVADYRMQNMNASPLFCLDQVIGRRYLESAPERERALAEARARGQRRIASQTTRPGGASRSTAASPDRRGRNQDAEDEALLRSITWGEANR